MQEKNNSGETKLSSFDVSNFIGKKESDKNPIEAYEQRRKTGEIFKCQFSCADKSGNLYFYDGDIKVIMPNKEISGQKYNPYDKGMKLTFEYPVVVLSVNQEKMEVRVSSFKAMEEPREILLGEIEKGLENKEYVCVDARITGVGGDNHSVAFLDIGGLGIKGSIRLSEWSMCYTSSFKYVTEIGSVVKVAVTGKANWKSGTLYDCSRRLTLNFDPWQEIEKKLPRNTTIVVKCLMKKEKNFFGQIQGIRELNVYCEYPDRRDISILEGGTYEGFVYAVSEEKRLLKVRITNQILEM